MACSLRGAVIASIGGGIYRLIQRNTDRKLGGVRVDGKREHSSQKD